MDRIYKINEHKFFDYLLAFLMGAAGFSVATNTRWLKDKDRIGFAGLDKVSGLNLWFFPKLLLDQIKANTYPQEIALHSEPSLAGVPSDLKHEINVAEKISSNIFQGAFIQFYDSIEEEIENKHGKARDKWPMTVNFGRVIRNAFAHGNRIYFKNPVKNKLSWKSLAFDHTNNGEKVLYNHVAPADIIILMEDMNDSL